MPTDTERLDWIEKQTNGMLWLARGSFTGRGFRLHNTSGNWPDLPHGETAREAIDAAMDAEIGSAGDSACSTPPKE